MFVARLVRLLCGRRVVGVPPSDLVKPPIVGGVLVVISWVSSRVRQLNGAASKGVLPGIPLPTCRRAATIGSLV
jgi:hypothetical protein